MATQTVCPIAQQIAGEFYRTRDAVVRAAASGYHLPHNNIHDDADFAAAYERGFAEGLRLVGRAA